MKFIADEQYEDIRIDHYLSEIMENLSRAKIQKLIREGFIKINGAEIKSSYKLKENDCITIEETDKLFSAPQILPENIPLDVVWENENMAVINKPSNMLTHPTAQELSGTLVNGLFYKYGENLSDINGEMRRGIVHRLDRNTSGLIMIAKNNKTHEYLANEIKEHNFVKKYLTIVKGILEQDEFTINKPIGRHPAQPHKQTIREDGKESITEVKVLQRFKDATLAEITLITGRTHQIRVHLSSIGHPVYNDSLYGFGKPKIKTSEQVLQAYKLEFTEPFTNKKIKLEISPDEDITKVIKTLSCAES